jgi:hypothetical protein
MNDRYPFAGKNARRIPGIPRAEGDAFLCSKYPVVKNVRQYDTNIILKKPPAVPGR